MFLNVRRNFDTWRPLLNLSHRRWRVEAILTFPNIASVLDQVSNRRLWARQANVLPRSVSTCATAVKALIWCKENVLLIRCRNSQYAVELWLQNNKTGHTVGQSKLSLRECSSASSYSWTQATNLGAGLLCRRWPIASKVCDRLSERRKMLTCSHMACVFVKRCVLLYVYDISTWNKWLSSRERKELAPVHLN